MHDDHDDDLLHNGLAFDLGTMVSRRRVLAAAIGTGAAVVLAACSSGDDDAGSTTTSPTSSPATTDAPASSTTGDAGGSAPGTAPGSGGPGSGGPGGAPPGGGGGGGAPGGDGADASTMTTNPDSGLSAVPEETAGPYPGDGSNGVNALSETGIVRTDIRSSFGTASGTAEGVPMSLRMTIVDVANGRPLEGAAVYVWHCDAEGRYSLYSEGAEDQNYLRGVQVAGADGVVAFDSIWPACYAGRWPHIHYEVYPDVACDHRRRQQDRDVADRAARRCEHRRVRAGHLPEQRRNYSRLSLETDGVFSDGTTNEIPEVSGSVTPATRWRSPRRFEA